MVMQVMEVLVRNRHDREVREELAQAFGLLSDHAPTLTKQRWVSTVMQLQGISLEAGERASISFSAEHSRARARACGCTAGSDALHVCRRGGHGPGVTMVDN